MALRKHEVSGGREPSRSIAKSPSCPELIFLDAGLVLLHPDGQSIAAALASRHGFSVSPDACLRAYASTIRARSFAEATGETAESFWLSWCRAVGIPERHASRVRRTIAALETGSARLWTVPDPWAHATLRGLRGLGIRLGVVSNADGELEQDLQRAGMLDYFELWIDSEREQMRKPDPRIFELALRRASAPAVACWMVGDDMVMDIDPAVRLGFGAAIHYDRFGLYGEPAGHWRVRSLYEVVALAGKARSAAGGAAPCAGPPWAGEP